jgi:hypothetical protein
VCGVCGPLIAGEPIRVLFLPFQDNVKLNESWDLAFDVPRWFAGTIDTIGGADSTVIGAPFDSVATIMKENGWSASEPLSAAIMRKLAARFSADFVVTGVVHRFKVMNRGLNANAAFTSEHALGSAVGKGGSTVIGGMHSYNASVHISADIHDKNGVLLKPVTLDTEKKEGGLEVWLPFQTESDEMTFYHMKRSPFGSSYFQKSVIGAVMKQFSRTLHDQIERLEPGDTQASPRSRSAFLEGAILERVGQDVYINLGQKDHLYKGELLQALKPSRPVLGDQGDTLGWIEEPAGVIEVRYIKSAHFSQGAVQEESDSLRAGWTVRPMRAEDQR